jgi:hypothetical protein
MSDFIDEECLQFLRGSLKAMPVVIRCSLLKPKASASDRLNWTGLAFRLVHGPVGRTATDLDRKNAREAADILREVIPRLRKFAMDIPQHGCGTKPIIICAALRLRWGKNLTVASSDKSPKQLIFQHGLTDTLSAGRLGLMLHWPPGPGGTLLFCGFSSQRIRDRLLIKECALGVRKGIFLRSLAPC